MGCVDCSSSIRGGAGLSLGTDIQAFGLDMSIWRPKYPGEADAAVPTSINSNEYYTSALGVDVFVESYGQEA